MCLFDKIIIISDLSKGKVAYFLNNYDRSSQNIRIGFEDLYDFRTYNPLFSGFDKIATT
jgi:hypothetical protein